MKLLRLRLSIWFACRAKRRKDSLARYELRRGK